LAQRQLGGTALLSGRPEAQLLSLLNGHSEQALAPAQGHGHTLPGDSSAGGLHDSEAHRSNGSRSSGAGAKVQLVQGWGLPTDSLRMQATNLQFVAESDGTLVQLGEGAHGVVYLAKMQETYVAVKVFAQQPGMDSQAFWQEVALLRRCVHPRIVPVYGVAVQVSTCCLALFVAVRCSTGALCVCVHLDSRPTHTYTCLLTLQCYVQGGVLMVYFASTAVSTAVFAPFALFLRSLCRAAC
jgi:hypothetical protein